MKTFSQVVLSRIVDAEIRSLTQKCFTYNTLSSLSGVYAAAHDLGVEWIVIKGVSDFADGKKSETNSWRPFASLMAASLVAHILKNPIIFENWGHFNDGKSSLLSSLGEKIMVHCLGKTRVSFCSYIYSLF